MTKHEPLGMALRRNALQTAILEAQLDWMREGSCDRAYRYPEGSEKQKAYLREAERLERQFDQSL